MKQHPGLRLMVWAVAFLVFCALATPCRAEGEDAPSRADRIEQLNEEIDKTEQALIEAEAKLEFYLDAIKSAVDMMDYWGDVTDPEAVSAAAVKYFTLEGRIVELNLKLAPLIRERDDLLAQPLNETLDRLASETAALRDRVSNIEALMVEAWDQGTLSAEDYEAGVALLRKLWDQIQRNENKISRLARQGALGGSGGSGGSGTGGSSGGNNGGSDPCFLAGTLVRMADGGYRAIETLRPGDMVLAHDADAGRNVPARVAEVRQGVEDHYYLLDARLRVNGAHRFFTASGGLVAAAVLAPGDMLLSLEGPVQLAGVQHFPLAAASLDPEPLLVRVYNVVVEAQHNYYVSGDGALAFLVHDDCRCAGSDQ